MSTRDPQNIEFKQKDGIIANFYNEINWENGFESWSLVRFQTPMDGSCLFHAIANSFFEPYRKEILNGNQVSRDKIIASLRKELAEVLSKKISDKPDAPTHYEILSGGNIGEFAKTIPEFTLEYMQEQLRARFSIGYGYIEHIGNVLKKDIYIIEHLRCDLYMTNEFPYIAKGNRGSIVLYYLEGHYELVGVRNNNGSFDTFFSPKHTFIKFLYNRMQQYIVKYDLLPKK